jgi:signal transduction histidine kinase
VFQKLELQFEGVAEARNVDLRFRATIACVESDEICLVRILENLISNAIQFTRDRVLVCARPRSDGWSIEVWDRGPGIPIGSEEAIFETFYQHSPYADPKREGVGLGLSIVRKLAKSLSYSVVVRSRKERGSVFKVIVPAKSQQPGDRAYSGQHSSNQPSLA